MKKKNNWKKIFSSKEMSYIKLSYETINSISKNNISTFLKSYSLTKIIYPLLNKSIFKNMIGFFTKEFSNLLIKNKFKRFTNMLDFGSGNGAFIFYFINKLNLKDNYSLELSKELLLLQKKFVKKSKFIHINNNSNTLFFKKIKNNAVDISISTSVFQYFRSNKYAFEVLNNLIRVSKKIIILYDIKNLDVKKTYLISLRERQKLTKKNFTKKYRNTPLRFYSKNFFMDKFKNNKKVKKIKFLKMPSNSLDGKYGYSVVFELI